MTHEIAKNLGKYRDDHQRAFPLVVAASLTLIAVLAALVFWSPFTDSAFAHQLFDTARAERLLFTGYFMVLVAMWGIYFLSSYDWGKIRTLRKLLSLTSEIFGRDSYTPPPDAGKEQSKTDNSNDELAAALREKARNSVTMLAMLTAAATLMFTRSLDLAYQPGVTDSWHVYLAYASAAAALTAAICFVISVDSYDVMYNLFGVKDSVERVQMLQFFYNSTRNTRYYGVMFLLWAVCLFAGARSPLLGALAISLIVCMGWSHWFPAPSAFVPLKIIKPEWSPASGLVRAAFILLPLFWHPVRTWAGFFLTGF